MRRLQPVDPVIRSVLVFLLIVGLAASTQAQRLAVDADKGTNKHVMYLEALGAGYFYSINYERLLLNKRKFGLFARAGFEYIPFGGADKLVHFPIGTNATYGNRKHRVEVGVAALFRLNFDPGVGFGDGYYFTNPPTRIFLVPSVGWRFHAKPNEWGDTFFMRITVNPVIGLDVFQGQPAIYQQALHYFGVSIGRTWSNPNRKGK